jgi:hypothetical protein
MDYVGFVRQWTCVFCLTLVDQRWRHFCTTQAVSRCRSARVQEVAQEATSVHFMRDFQPIWPCDTAPRCGSQVLRQIGAVEGPTRFRARFCVRGCSGPIVTALAEHFRAGSLAIAPESAPHRVRKKLWQSTMPGYMLIQGLFARFVRTLRGLSGCLLTTRISRFPTGPIFAAFAEPFCHCLAGIRARTGMSPTAEAVPVIDNAERHVHPVDASGRSRLRVITLPRHYAHSLRPVYVTLAKPFRDRFSSLVRSPGIKASLGSRACSSSET